MSRFYGTVQGNRGVASRTGSDMITTYAASHEGAIRVEVMRDEAGRDKFYVTQVKWQGYGVWEPLAEGFIGEKTRAGQVTDAILKE